MMNAGEEHRQADEHGVRRRLLQADGGAQEGQHDDDAGEEVTMMRIDGATLSTVISRTMRMIWPVIRAARTEIQGQRIGPELDRRSGQSRERDGRPEEPHAGSPRIRLGP